MQNAFENSKNQIIHTNDKETQYRLAHFLGGRINKGKKKRCTFTESPCKLCPERHTLLTRLFQ